MGFSIFEISDFLGRRVCLYEFQWGNDIYRYTSADREVEWGALSGDPPIKWQPLAIKDNGFTQGVTAEEFVVELPRSNEIVQLFRATPPSLPITLTCRRFHRDDPDNEAAVYWVGTISNVRGKDAITAELLGNPISQSMRRTGLRLCWERGCPHALYDQDCKVNPNAFRTNTTITALTGSTVQVAGMGAFPPARYSGGYLEWQATGAGTLDRRAIERGDGNTLYLLGTTDRLIVGQAVSIYCGCDLTATTCKDFFNNLPNHGGFEMLPGKSPFDGNPVF
jgi:uncharacterized phage protein (TIGR02218 family)